MKNINIRNGSSKGISRFDPKRSKRMYFTSQRKLLELERNSWERPVDKKQAAKQIGLKIKKLMTFTVVVAFLTPLVLNGCSSTQNTDSSSYEKSKSSYEKKRGGSYGGY